MPNKAQPRVFAAKARGRLPLSLREFHRSVLYAGDRGTVTVRCADSGESFEALRLTSGEGWREHRWAPVR